jgi:hypothetical protein
LKLTLKFDLVLNDQRLLLGADGLREFGGDGMVSSLVLDDETLVTNHAIEDLCFLNGPLSNVSPLLFAGGALLLLLLCMRRLPPSIPVGGELF